MTQLLTPPTKSTSRSPARTLKVLHVVNGQHYAGAARVQDLLALSLPELGYDVSFACVLPDRFATMRQSQNSPLDDVPMKHKLDFSPAWKVADLVRANGIDLLHSHTTRSAMIAAVASKITGIPYVHHVHCQMNTEVGHRIKTAINMSIERWACNRADRTIAVSGSIQRFLLDNRFTKTPITVVPNGVPAPVSLKPSRNAGDPWTIGMVALLRERKGLETLLRSLPLLRQNHDVRLRIVGAFESETYEAAIRQLASELNVGEHVDWTGFTRNVNHEIQQMDVLVLPSVLPEGMPMVLLEAMSAGVPIVGSSVDGIVDVIQHESNGLLFEPNNPQSLADQLQRILNGQINWSDLRQNCLNDYQSQFSNHAMATGVAKVYDEILRPHEL